MHHWKESQLVDVFHLFGRGAVPLHQHIVVVGKVLDVDDPLLRNLAPVDPVSDFYIRLQKRIKLLTKCFCIVIFGCIGRL